MLTDTEFQMGVDLLKALSGAGCQQTAEVAKLLTTELRRRSGDGALNALADAMQVADEGEASDKAKPAGWPDSFLKAMTVDGFDVAVAPVEGPEKVHQITITVR